jgi:hypothetical protein
MREMLTSGRRSCTLHTNGNLTRSKHSLSASSRNSRCPPSGKLSSTILMTLAETSFSRLILHLLCAMTLSQSRKVGNLVWRLHFYSHVRAKSRERPARDLETPTPTLVSRATNWMRSSETYSTCPCPMEVYSALPLHKRTLDVALQTVVVTLLNSTSRRMGRVPLTHIEVDR